MWPLTRETDRFAIEETHASRARLVFQRAVAMELLTAFCEVGAYTINSRASAAACTLQFGIRGSSSSSTVVQSLSGTMSENETVSPTGRGKAKAAKTKKPKTLSSHPTYMDMAVAAINALKERNGSSRQAILKYITSHYNIGKDASVVNTHLKVALKKGVNSAVIKHAKGQGASGSFRISEKPGSPVKKPAKKAAKPKAAPKAEKAKAETVKTPKKSPKKKKKKEAATPAKVKIDKKAKSPKKVAEKKQTVKAKKPRTPKKAAPKKKTTKTPVKAKAKVNSQRKAKK